MGAPTLGVFDIYGGAILSSPKKVLGTDWGQQGLCLESRHQAEGEMAAPGCQWEVCQALGQRDLARLLEWDHIDPQCVPCMCVHV